MKEEKERWETPREYQHGRGEDINDKIIINLRDVSHIIRSFYEGKGSQKRVLIVLEKQGGQMTQRELTRQLGIQPGSASEVIAKLEGAGYIERSPDETDRRTVKIQLTESGKQLAVEARAQRIQRYEEMFSGFTEAEKEELLSLLEKLNCDWELRYGHLRETEKEHCGRKKGCGHHRRR